MNIKKYMIRRVIYMRDLITDVKISTNEFLDDLIGIFT